MRSTSILAMSVLLVACSSTARKDTDDDEHTARAHPAASASATASAASSKPRRSRPVPPLASIMASAMPATTPSSHTFTVTATSFKAGEHIEVKFDSALDPPKGSRFWITIIPAAAADGEFGTWHYVANGATSDSVVAPVRGDYEIRLHDAYPMFPFRVMSRQRVSIVDCRSSSDCGDGRACESGACAGAPPPPPPPPARPPNACENAMYPGTFCVLSSGLRGYCNLTSGQCDAECPNGMGLAPDGQCYLTCPAGGDCGDGCSCQWSVCVCPPGD